VLRPLARLPARLLVTLGVLASCGASPAPNPRLVSAQTGGALGLADALEALIDDGQATNRDRSWAYEQVVRTREDDASAAYARALVTARLVESRGLRAASLVRDVEREAERSRELDPGFRSGAATEVLGMLYVMAPGMLLSHGNSERGISLLEELVRRYPNVLEHRLRLAEAYVSLGDPDSAEPHACRCLEHQPSLKPRDRRRLDRLVAENRELKCRKDPLASPRGGSKEPPAAR
jgi:hypothetical protein